MNTLNVGGLLEFQKSLKVYKVRSAIEERMVRLKKESNPDSFVHYRNIKVQRNSHGVG